LSATRADALRWLREERPAVLVELVQVRGSVPREAGTRMLVAANDACGTIGGGHLEHQAILEARALLRGGHDFITAPELRRRLSLGPSLGQCCGGSVELSWRPLDAAVLEAWPSVMQRFRLQLHGAGHVGRALMRILSAVPCRVDWIDAREAFDPWSDAGAERLPLLAQVQVHQCEEPQTLVASARQGDLVLIATHRHDLDERIATEALRRNDLGWVGMIGSATKRARILRRLLERGLKPEQAGQLVCPIGIAGYEGIGAKEPGVIALAVAAQLLQTSARSAHAPDR
jgi:xanthine dehydrogenase accessory factor